MANTITQTRGIFTISAIDSDWDLGYDVLLHAIDFTPGAASDQCVIKVGSDAGAVIFNMLSVGGESCIKYFNGLLTSPYLDVSAGTFSANSLVIVTHLLK